LAVIPSLSAQCQQNNISITITNIRSDSGLIRLGLYDQPEQFPNNPGRSFTYRKTVLKDGNIQLTLEDIPPGIYAISLLDDEDENGRMKFNILRMPKEGYGFSNNAKPGHRSPPFEKCTFSVGEGNTNLRIEMQYFREKA
jgi:uncharacterized protein (DUF2141 family)